MKIGITGDTHGDLDFRQIYKARKQGCSHIIITGDFGYVWRGDWHEQKVLDYMDNLGIQILFCDGNHENHILLNEYPVSNMYEGKVHKIRDNIIHLMRGEVYKINNKKYFTFGGANSTDKEFRKEGKSWWKEEKPSEEDKRNAEKNLFIHNYKVDYIITHTCYPLALDYVGGDMRIDDVSDYLNFIRHGVDFKYWFFGHMHVNYDILDYNTRCIYKDIIILD